ncbi:MAG: hypothetical protein ACI8UO_001599 [Verrucomicrobiales bacterium]|jgi:hypothetical protein
MEFGWRGSCRISCRWAAGIEHVLELGLFFGELLLTIFAACCIGTSRVIFTQICHQNMPTLSRITTLALLIGSVTVFAQNSSAPLTLNVLSERIKVLQADTAEDSSGDRARGRDHHLVLVDPEPQGLFDKFGDSALGF